MITGKTKAEHLEILSLWKAIRHLESKRAATLFSLNKFSLKVFKQFFTTFLLIFQNLLALHKIILLDKPEMAGKLRRIYVELGGVPFVPVGPKNVRREIQKVLKFIHEGFKMVPNPIEFSALAHFAFVSRNFYGLWGGDGPL